MTVYIYVHIFIDINISVYVHVFIDISIDIMIYVFVSYVFKLSCINCLQDMHLDGHGGPALKIKTYNGLYTDARADLITGGFKVFDKQDKPKMTPKQVLGLEEAGNKKVKDMPKITTYQ